MNQNVRLVVLAAALVALGVLLWNLLGESPKESAPQPATPESAAQSADTFGPGDFPLAGSAPSAPAGSARAAARGAAQREQGLRGEQVITQRAEAAGPAGKSVVFGTVTYKESGQPVPGATVTMEASKWDEDTTPLVEIPKWTATTNSSGYYEIRRVPRGAYTLVAAKDGAMAQGYADVEEENEDEASIELEAGGRIAGRVLNEAGEPVMGATVFPDHHEGRPDIGNVGARILRKGTDENGAFAIEGLWNGEWKLTVLAKNYAVYQSDLIPVGTEDAEFRLSSGGSISGRVVDAESGASIEGVAVRVAASESYRNQFKKLTESGGTFRFDHLSDSDYSVSVDDKTRVLVGDAKIVTIQHAADIENIELRATLGGAVTGRVYNAETEAPLEGVRITAQPATRGATTRESMSDANGIYLLEGLQAGQYRLRRRWKAGLRHGENREDKTVVVKLGETMEGIDFPVYPGLNVRGHVVDTAGKPVRRAHVASATMVETGEGEETYTNKDGAFEHRGFSPNSRIVVTAAKEGLTSEPVGPLEMGDTDLEGVEVVMEKGASVAGVVVDRRGQPVADVSVSIWPYTYDRTSRGGSAMSESDGAFLVQGLREGVYRISMYKSEGTTRRQVQGENITLAKGEDKTGLRLVFEQSEGLEISGRVTNRRGEPVKDANVNAHLRMGGESWGSAQTDEDGNYTISGLKEGVHFVGVYHQEYSQAQDEVEAGSRGVDFTLEARGAIEGRVVNAASGAPLTQFELASFPGQGQWQPWMAQQMQTFADPNGQFLLENVEAGETTLYAQAKGFAPLTEFVGEVRPGDTLRGVELRLVAGGAVEGRVLSAAGQPVAGAQIHVGRLPEPWMRQQMAARATTDSSGRFTLDSLTLEPQDIWAAHPNYAPASAPVTPSAGSVAQVEIVLGAGGSVEGVVTSNGAPAAGVSISVYYPEGAGAGGQFQAQTNAQGRYALSGLPAGAARVSAFLPTPGASRGRQQAQQAIIEADAVTEVDFAFQTGTAVIEGVVTQNGRPIGQAHISVTLFGDVQQQDSVNAQVEGGRYRLEGLPAGQVTLMLAYSAGATWRNRRFDVQTVDGQVTRYDIELDSGATLSGTVSGLGAGEMGQLVALRGEIVVDRLSMDFYQQQQRNFAGASAVQTNGGAYSIEGLEPGRYTVFAVATQPGAPPNFDTMRFTTSVIEVSQDTNIELNITIP